MTPFYINLVLYSLSIPLVLFLLPESLSSDARLILAKRARLAEDADARREAAEIEWEDETPVLPRVGMNERGEHAQEEEDPLVSGRSLRFDGMNGHLKRRKMKETIKRLGKKATGFLAPLAIFLPKIVEEDEKEDEDGEVRVSGRVRREWNMTVMGMGMFLMSMLYVSTLSLSMNFITIVTSRILMWVGYIIDKNAILILRLWLDIRTGQFSFDLWNTMEKSNKNTENRIVAWTVHVCSCLPPEFYPYRSCSRQVDRTLLG